MSGALPTFYTVRVHLKTGGFLDFRFDDLGPADECRKGVVAGKKSGKPLRVSDGVGIETHFDDDDVRNIGPISLIDESLVAAGDVRQRAFAVNAALMEQDRLAKLGIIPLPPAPAQMRPPANGTGGGPGIPAPGSFLPAAPGSVPPFAG